MGKHTRRIYGGGEQDGWEYSTMARHISIALGILLVIILMLIPLAVGIVWPWTRRWMYLAVVLRIYGPHAVQSLRQAWRGVRQVLGKEPV